MASAGGHPEAYPEVIRTVHPEAYPEVIRVISSVWSGDKRSFMIFASMCRNVRDFDVNYFNQGY